jgi:HSP20 family protein
MAERKRNLDDLQGEIQELFADLWQVPRFAGIRSGFRPQCDCYSTDDPPTLHVVVELPGVAAEAVEVVASGQSLLIAGVRERPTIAGARYQSMEIEYGAFQRRFDLGREIDAERATAVYERGLLKITLPVAERETRHASVPIEVRR